MPAARGVSRTVVNRSQQFNVQTYTAWMRLNGSLEKLGTPSSPNFCKPQIQSGSNKHRFLNQTLPTQSINTHTLSRCYLLLVVERAKSEEVRAYSSCRRAPKIAGLKMRWGGSKNQGSLLEDPKNNKEHSILRRILGSPFYLGKLFPRTCPPQGTYPHTPQNLNPKSPKKLSTHD